MKSSLKAMLAIVYLSHSGPGCDAPGPTALPAARQAPLEYVPTEGSAGDTDNTLAGVDGVDGMETDEVATAEGVTKNEVLAFDDQVALLQSESETFRSAIASARLLDALPEGFVRATVLEPTGQMRCDEPPSPADLEPPPTEALRGDEQRHVGFMARLSAMKPGDLASEHDACLVEPPATTDSP